MVNKVVYTDNTGNIVWESIDPRLDPQIFINRFKGRGFRNVYIDDDSNFPADTEYHSSWSSSLTLFDSVYLATSSVLPNSPVYADGIITSTGNPGSLNIDSVVVSNGTNILVKDQATNTENGIYTVTDDGTDPGPNWSLTRTVGVFDSTTVPLKVNSTIEITGGTANSSTSWNLNATVEVIDTDAVTFTGLTLFNPVLLATTVALPDSPAYVDGIITSTGEPANLTIDSVVASNGDRILVQDQATNTQNGIYTVTHDGTPAPNTNTNVNWEITRSSDFVSGVEPIYANSIILVTSGTTHTNSYLSLDATVNTIDTDAVTFSNGSAPVTTPTIDIDMPTARVIQQDTLRNQRSGLFLETDKLFIEATSEGRDTAAIETRQVYLRNIPSDPAIAAATNTTALKAVTIASWTPPNVSEEIYCDYKRTEIDSASYTILSTDHIVGIVHTGTAAVALTLPEISSAGMKKYNIIDEGGNAATNNITIGVSGSDTINGVSSQTINTNYGKMILYNNGGTGWFIM